VSPANVKICPRDGRIDLDQRFPTPLWRSLSPRRRQGVMAEFVIEMLSRDQLRSVYPLVREAVPAIGLTTWLRFARQLTGPRRAGQCGIVAARREGREFPSGLFCYRVEDDLKLGKVLIADHFVAVDLLDPAAVLAALVEELDRLAKRLACQAVRSLVHGGV